MCGIVGYIGHRDASNVILSGLQRLEYRGYDSAGIAVRGAETFSLRRSVGKLQNLIERVQSEPVVGTVGIGHTRWATHGGVTEHNAHPHQDQSGSIVVVQNGIVENYRQLKQRLVEHGAQFRSQTDTEVIAYLVSAYYATTGSLTEAVRYAMRELRGGNAIVAMSLNEPEILVAARVGNAGGVVLGAGDGEYLVASDMPALLEYTQRVITLEDGDVATITADAVWITTLEGAPVERPPTTPRWNSLHTSRGSYEHFMLKEIHEQPRVLTEMIWNSIDRVAGRVTLADLRLDDHDLTRLERIHAVGCGTAWHAALVGKYLVEQIARVPVEVDYSSEFRYRKPLLGAHTLLIAVTQSGETADTLAAMEEARAQGVPCVALVNAEGSQAARRADAGALYLQAGPEIGVASTKAFTAMLASWYLLALRLAQARCTLSSAQLDEHLRALLALPHQVSQVLKHATIPCQDLAPWFAKATNALYLGRQMHYPIALEGALKLKEISYIHAEGYPAGEMKHGPIALVDEHLPVVCIIPHDAVYEKMLSNLEQVQARGGRVIAIATRGDDLIHAKANYVISIPATLPLLAPILAVVPLQLLAYHVAVRRGCDVDQPRNLAKSVTVE